MDLKEEIISLLNEEKWTRAALHSYSVSSFTHLDEILANQLSSTDFLKNQEILEVCQEHLLHAKNSIIALYISGLMKLSLQNIDDSDLVQLIRIFSDNYKKNIVEFLAHRILDSYESKFALQALAQIYEDDEVDDKLLETWERLIQADRDETVVAIRLAEKQEEMNEYDAAIKNYKKALHRYINKKDSSQIKKVWNKLVELAPNELEFFYHAITMVEVGISSDRAVQLLSTLYPVTQNQLPDSIALLKRILHYDAHNEWARKELVNCYREYYANKSNIEKYISISNLTQSIRNVHEAIASFEKHMAFDVGNFVYHKSWGVGRIREVNVDNIIIDFAKRRGHPMSIEMAGSSLETLTKNHIKVLKNISKKDQLRKKVKEDIIWTLKIIIQSYNNCADTKQIRDELVPSILTAQEWVGWGAKARTILRSNPAFGVVPDKQDTYSVYKEPVAFTEKTLRRFEMERTFFDKVIIFYYFLDGLAKEELKNLDSDAFHTMFQYFLEIANRVHTADVHRVSAVLLVEHVVKTHDLRDYQLAENFETVYKQISNVVNCITKITHKHIRSMFIRRLPELDENCYSTLAQLFCITVSKEIADILRDYEDGKELRTLYGNLLRDYRRYRLAFVWLVRYITANDFFDKIIADDQELLFITLLHIYELTLRDLDAKTNISEQRKIQKHLITYLFSDGNLQNYFHDAGKQQVMSVFTLLQETRHIDPKLLLGFRNNILERFPSFEFHVSHAQEMQIVRGGFFVTFASYEKRQSELIDIRDKELIKNSKEIERARAYGDLKENAEYKAALENQQALQNRMMLLENELRQARIIEQKDIDVTKITFGTQVKLASLSNQEKTDYIVLGPWESDPDHGIISYQSPLGQQLYNRKIGEQVELRISGVPENYEIEEIAMAPVQFVAKV